MKHSIYLFVLIALLLSGCSMISNKKIRGNGILKEMKIDVSKFDDINVSAAIQVYVRQDSFYAVRVEAEENLMDFINIDATYRYELVLGAERGYNLQPTKPIKVFVSSPMVRLFEASGASSIVSETLLNADNFIHINCSGASTIMLELEAEKIDVDLSGASTVKLKGNTSELLINGSGASTVNSYELLANSVDIDLAGASKGYVYAGSLLKAEVSGASAINYKGSAAVTKNVSGASSVEKVQ